MDRCPTSGKIRYRRERAAKNAVKGVERKQRLEKAKAGREVVVLEHYFCEDCDGWHVATKNPLAPRTKGRRRAA